MRQTEQTSQNRSEPTMGPMLVIQWEIQLTPMEQSSVAPKAQTWGLCWVRYLFRLVLMLVQWTARRMTWSLEWQ